LRIADWFGMPAVFCSPDCVDAYSPKVVQASMGAILRIPVFEAELATLKTRVPELPLAGAVLDGEDVFEAALPPNGLLAIGNEGRGLRPEAEALLDRRLAIPRAPGGRAESLNAAVAAGIFAAVWQQKTGD
ncbi:MAG: RNA methyltransferase, partial [Saprospiraceae bacterium]|nr:RNA methyltransferase [Saprospiraceae bacterium]